MISNSPDGQTSLIIHISRPVRSLLKKFSLLILFIIALVGIFASRSDSNIAYSIRTTFSDVFSPVISFVSAPIDLASKAGESFNSYLFVHGKNNKLRSENIRLRKELVKLTGSVYENQSLQRLLNYIKDKDYKYISARVVGNVSGPFSSSILINAGSNEGVKTGQAVVNDEGLIGRVIEVGKISSRVLLLTDINSNIPVISNKSRERSIMSGNNTSNPQLVYLPNGSSLKNGEVVVTSGDGDLFPPDLQVGVVNLSQDGTYTVQTFAQPHRIEYLSIIDYSEKL